jgi:predicted ATPase
MEISEKYDLVTQQEILRLYLPINQPINDKEVNVTLADVGFGVSQILPILVEGLRIQPNQTLILEQPEIHLHPKLQMQLADFFISMILSGKRILLETHSDHIINRIVRRIIENEENEISSKINILFFEVGENGSKPRNVEIDSDRGIINWPKGFFDQSAIEKKTIIQSGIERRKKIIRE